MKKIVSTIKEFTLYMLKNSWFKMLVFILIGSILYIVIDFSDVHLQEVKRLEVELKAGKVSYEEAQFYRSALHEQIVYQLAFAIIVAMVMVAGLLMEQNSKLRERVRRIDFRLWKLDRNIEDIYELNRLMYANSTYRNDENDYIYNEIVDEEDRETAQQELERLQEEQRKLIKEVQELEKKYLSKIKSTDSK